MAHDPASRIDRGSLAAIFSSYGKGEAPPIQPVLQCVQVRPLAGQQGTPDRFRVVFSDINNFVQSMLATQACGPVHEGKLRKGCFVRLKEYQANQMKGKRVLIVLDLEVVEELGECEKLGEPKALEFKEEDDEPRNTTMNPNGFYGSKPEQKPEQNYSEKNSLARPSNTQSAAHANIYPIEAISPYSHKWTIKVRVTHKSDIKTWKNNNGDGKLFSVNFLDESGEIRGTGFNDQCDTLYNVFQEGSVYYITSPCRVNLAKKQFSNLNNDYELMFERDTQVEKAEEQTGVPQVRFNFTNIRDLESVDKNSTIDIIGVLKEVGETSEIVSNTTKKPYEKRDLTLVDNTGVSVRLTIWGKTATSFDANLDSVLAFKGVKVSDFNGRSLSLLSSGSMTVDPDIDDAHKLKGWYLAQGKNETFSTHAQMAGSMGAAGGRSDPSKTLLQVIEENLGMTEDADYFTTKATIVYVSQKKFAYPACLRAECNKKVIEENPGEWRCAKCDVTHPKPEYRYITSVNVCDHTGHLYLNCFDDVGKLVMGMSADDLMKLQEDDERAAQDAFQNATCKTFNFRCRAKMDVYEDQTRVRYTVLSAAPLDFSQECSKLAEAIKAYSIA